MWDSIYRLPNEFNRFWETGILIKAQVLFLLFLLYLLGYYSSKLLVNRSILKWGLFIFLALPFLIPIYNSKDIIFIFPIALGMIKGLFLGNSGSNPLGAFEGITDFFLSLKQRRGEVKLHQKYEEAEEILRKAKEYENQTRNQYQEQANAKEQFREEMKRERQREEREAKEKSNSNSGKEHRKQSTEAEQKINQSKPKELDPNVLADAYEILGVNYGASLAECKKARFTLLSMYHPDKVVHLNETRRNLAEVEAKRINASWEKVRKC